VDPNFRNSKEVNLKLNNAIQCFKTTSLSTGKLKKKIHAISATTAGKVDIFPGHVKKASRGSRGTALLILNLGTIRR
jgi:hypothetical protein